MLIMIKQRFHHINLDALNKQIPWKKKHVRVNQMPFFYKELSKAITAQTKLRNIFLWNRIDKKRIRYTKQGNVRSLFKDYEKMVFGRFWFYRPRNHMKSF